MSLILPHRPSIARHPNVPYLWRAHCPVCNWTAFAGTEHLVRLAAQSHVDEEEPFPFDMISENPEHGRDD